MSAGLVCPETLFHTLYVLYIIDNDDPHKCVIGCGTPMSVVLTVQRQDLRLILEPHSYCDGYTWHFQRQKRQ